MSIEEDRLVLNEYDAWQTVNVRKDVDLSVEAFLTERKHNENALRIAYAIDAIGPDYPEEGYQELKLDNGYMFALDTLWHVRYALTTQPTKEFE